MSYKTTAREQIYQGRIINVYKDTIEFENGLTSIREVVEHDDAAAVLAVDAEGLILFVRQYRHAAGIDSLEIPAGLCEKGEQPLACAYRELEEETGYKTDLLIPLGWLYSSIGICNERIYYYLAEQIYEGCQNLDQDEEIEIERYSLADAKQKIYSNEICDGKTIAAIYAYQDLLANRKK